MTPQDFKRQLDKLIETYGSKAYPQPRADLLWAEFKSVDTWVFDRVVSRLIGENTQPPMLPKFRETIAIVREKQVSCEKSENLKPFQSLVSKLESDDQKIILQGIMKALQEPDSKKRNYQLSCIESMIDGVIGRQAS